MALPIRCSGFSECDRMNLFLQCPKCCTNVATMSIDDVGEPDAIQALRTFARLHRCAIMYGSIDDAPGPAPQITAAEIEAIANGRKP